MITSEQLAILRSRRTVILACMLARREGFIQYCLEHSLPDEWVKQEEQVISIIKSELARRGEFE